MSKPRLTNPVMKGLERLAREVRAKDAELVTQTEEIKDRRSRFEAVRELDAMRRAADWIEAMSVARGNGCLYDDLLDQSHEQAVAS